MEKIRIVKDGITRSIHEKDAAKWGGRGYKRVEATPAKAKASTKADK